MPYVPGIGAFGIVILFLKKNKKQLLAGCLYLFDILLYFANRSAKLCHRS
jgi:hypothetical protein